MLRVVAPGIHFLQSEVLPGLLGVCREGSEPGLGAVLTGSHTDAIPWRGSTMGCWGWWGASRPCRHSGRKRQTHPSLHHFLPFPLYTSPLLPLPSIHLPSPASPLSAHLQEANACSGHAVQLSPWEVGVRVCPLSPSPVAVGYVCLGRAGFRPRRSLEVLMFTSEEPTRFGLSCLGRSDTPACAIPTAGPVAHALLM